MWVLQWKRVLRRVLRRGSEKGVSRRCLERPLEEPPQACTLWTALKPIGSPLLKNFWEPFPRTCSEPFLEACVVVRPPRHVHPGKEEGRNINFLLWWRPGHSAGLVASSSFGAALCLRFCSVKLSLVGRFHVLSLRKYWRTVGKGSQFERGSRLMAFLKQWALFGRGNTTSRVPPEPGPLASPDWHRLAQFESVSELHSHHAILATKHAG